MGTLGTIILSTLLDKLWGVRGGMVLWWSCRSQEGPMQSSSDRWGSRLSIWVCLHKCLIRSPVVATGVGAGKQQLSPGWGMSTVCTNYSIEWCRNVAGVS